MTVLLRASRSVSAADAHGRWVAVAGAAGGGLDRARRLSDLERRLEGAFEAERETWWALSRRLAGTPGAELSHTVACGAFGSDFGLMLAWIRLVGELAVAPETTLVVCDDPWLFRALAMLPGIVAGRAPALWPAIWRWRLRGWMARCALAMRLMCAALVARRWRQCVSPGSRAILVYGHPASRTDGYDAYFGTLMREIPSLARILHADCAIGRASELAADGRTASLHGWGSPWFALTLPWRGWHPDVTITGPPGWLVRRAAAIENGGGGSAMNRWQMHCQRRLLAVARPAAIAWPWENHAWERDLCRAARAIGTATVGYQHTVIGRHQINYAVRHNVDGFASIPDRVIADGPAYRDELLAWGFPSERLVVGGAWRFLGLADRAGRRFDPKAPIFVPLSATPPIARLQIAAAQRVAATGRRVLVKEHPMYPQAIAEDGMLRRTTLPMPDHERLSAVIYATGTSGLEAMLLGLPALRLLAPDRISIDVLPASLSRLVRAVGLDEIPAALDGLAPPPPVPFTSVLAPVDLAVWKTLLIGDRQGSPAVVNPVPCIATP